MAKSQNLRNLLLLTSFSSTTLAVSYFGYKEIKRRDSVVAKDNLKISFATHPKNPKLLPSPFTSKDGSHYCGEDAFVLSSFSTFGDGNGDGKTITLVGIADGVGSWSKKGIDPGHFARGLMREVGLRKPMQDLKQLMSSSFSSLYTNISSYPVPPFGSSTCCLLAISDGSFLSANLGDSGFILVRDGKVLDRSVSLQSRFNCPYQLTMVPLHLKGKNATSKSGDPTTPTELYRSGDPTKAALLDGDFKRGDILVIGTDGLWDNLWDAEILSVIASSKTETVSTSSNLAEAIADASLKASTKQRSLSDGPSPFGDEAIKQGVPDAKELYWHGKKDDITVVTVECA